ncbi:MAG: cyanophycinase [Polaribacter sp.]|jgi:cyanophycinase
MIKKLITVGVLLGLFFQLCISCTQEQKEVKTNAKGKLFIIGGGKRPSAIVDRIISESGIDKNGYGVILPMSSSEPDTSAYYAKLQFLKKGLKNVHGLIFTKNEVLSAAKLDSIKNAKLIYISGGDQNKFMDIVGNTAIEKAIHQAYKDGSLIAGTSAGAAVMSKMMITGSELKNIKHASTLRNIQADNIEIKSGLGMLNNVIIDQHFVKRSRYNRLISVVIEHPEKIGIGIDESTAILVKGATVEVVGDSQVLIFKNPKQSKNTYKDKLGAHGIVLNIHLPGEIFTIK